MTQIFIFTAGDLSARSHLDDSIKSPVSFSKLEKNIDKSIIDEKLYFYNFLKYVIYILNSLDR